jgi:hypothetical protein
LVLQDRDRRVATLLREKADIPKRKQMIEERLEDHRTALEAAREAQTRQNLRIKELEGDVETFKTRARKYKEQQLGVKNNDEYRALGREIMSTERSIRKLEDQELEVMEAQQGVDSRVEDRGAELSREQAAVQDELNALDERMVQIEQELERFKTGREELTAGIDPSWLSRYERIFKHVGDFAIVGVENGSCGGCHMRLPPQLVHDARKASSLTICSYCGRILNSMG